MARAPSERARAGLIELARTRNSAAGTAALDVLATHAPDRAQALVREALAEPNANTRVLALRIAARVPMEDSDDLTLLRTLMRDNNPFVRIESATLLLGRSPLCAE
jgi:hypothetical protein